MEKETKKGEGLSRAERKRRIRQIQRDLEARKLELGLRAPTIRRGPVFYLTVVVGLAAIGAALIDFSGKSGGGKRIRDGKIAQAERSVAALAEALGRYKFHCGEYPCAEDGLAALEWKHSRHEGWVGPYIPKLLKDPWKRDYVYELGTNGTAAVACLGPDGKLGTADDILPDGELYGKPFRDTTWTNDWAPFRLRGYIVVPNEAAKRAKELEIEMSRKGKLK